MNILLISLTCMYTMKKKKDSFLTDQFPHIDDLRETGVATISVSIKGWPTISKD